MVGPESEVSSLEVGAEVVDHSDHRQQLSLRRAVVALWAPQGEARVSYHVFGAILLLG